MKSSDPIQFEHAPEKDSYITIGGYGMSKKSPYPGLRSIGYPVQFCGTCPGSGWTESKNFGTGPRPG